MSLPLRWPGAVRKPWPRWASKPREELDNVPPLAPASDAPPTASVAVGGVFFPIRGANLPYLEQTTEKVTRSVKPEIENHMLRTIFLYGAAGLFAQDSIVLKTSTLFDGKGKTLHGANIVVEGGKIARVGGAAPAGALTYDLTAFTVSPGWIDTHSH